MATQHPSTSSPFLSSLGRKKKRKRKATHCKSEREGERARMQDKHKHRQQTDHGESGGGTAVLYIHSAIINIPKRKASQLVTLRATPIHSQPAPSVLDTSFIPWPLGVSCWPGRLEPQRWAAPAGLLGLLLLVSSAGTDEGSRPHWPLKSCVVFLIAGWWFTDGADAGAEWGWKCLLRSRRQTLYCCLHSAGFSPSCQHSTTMEWCCPQHCISNMLHTTLP